MSLPRTSTRPDWILRTPEISARTVDLPTPSGPINPTSLPAGNSRDKESTASRLAVAVSYALKACNDVVFGTH